MILKGGYLVVTSFLKIQRYTPAVATKVFSVILPKKLSWERLKNCDFEEIDFVKSPTHSLLDFKRAFLATFEINKPLRPGMT